MLGIFCKTLSLPFQSSRNVGNSVYHLFFLQTAPIRPKSFSSKSSLASEEEKDRSFIVSYLTNSCGLSPETALSLSKRVKIKTLEKPDAVLRFFREYGFTETHISKLVRCGPNLLLANVEKRIFPKFEFFHSIGISGSDLVRVITKNPSLLLYSLEKTIVPFYDVISQFLPVQKVQKIFRGSNWQFSNKLPNNCGLNILALREVGVPNPLIASLLVRSRAAAVTRDTEKFKENVARVISMGFHPSTLTFTTALEVISLTSKSKWEDRIELYRKCGWTEDEILLAFRKFPYIMTYAKNNVMIKMDFFVNKMGWQPADVARTPIVLAYSLENRTIPRYSVIRVLLLKGLLKKYTLSTIVICTKKYFLDTFVLKFQEEVPELSNIFRGKMSLADLGLGFEDKCEKKQL